MKPAWRGWVLGGLAGACALVSGAHGQELGSSPVELAVVEQLSPEEKARERAQKETTVESIVAREELAAGRAFDPGFRARVSRGLASLPLLALEAQRQRLGLGPYTLGDTQADLVYTPVAPCRIIDTRVAGVPLAAGTTRDFLVAATDYSGQGASATTCGIPNGPATAAVINFVAVNPAGQGNLRAWPFGQPEPLSSIINYAAVGLNIANGLVVSLCDPATATCDFDLTVRANLSATHLVADVQGYFQKVRKEQVKSIVVTKRFASDVLIGYPCTSYTSIVVDAPVAGTVLVRASLQVAVGTHTAGATDTVYANLATDAATCDTALADQGFTQFTYVHNSQPSGIYYPAANLVKSFPVSAGINTFYVNGSNVQGTSNQRFYHVGIDATFVPN